MQSRKTLRLTQVIHTFILIAVCLAAEIVANAQITRDVGQIAVIEGDSEIISTSPHCGQEVVNMQALSRKFHQTHPHGFHFLIMFSTFNQLLHPDANCREQWGAFFMSVSNRTQGIGQNIFDSSVAYGSDKGILAGVINMNNLSNWQPDGGGVLSVLGQEVGHNWGAYVKFVGPGIGESYELLGRDLAHWSFFLHAASATSSASRPEASSLEGNYWTETSPGIFRSSTITDGYSPLDLYLMGLLPADQVGPIWYIANPRDVMPERTKESGPAAGVQAAGARTSITVQNIIAREGERIPGFGAAPKKFRQAFILLTKPGEDVTQSQLDQIERYRVAWESYFAQKTQNRGWVSAKLDGVVYVDRANTGAEDGSRARPYNTVAEGIENSAPHGTLVIKAGAYAEGSLTFTRFNVPLTVRAEGGPVTIGR